MIYICLLLVIILVIFIYQYIKKDKQIKRISQQVEQVLYQQKDIYVQYYHEGSLSVLESEIVKLVNLLYEKNKILEDEKLLLKQSLEDISHQMKTPLTSLNLIQERLKTSDQLEKRKLLKEQQQLLDKIEWLVYSLLNIASLDAGTVNFHLEHIQPSDMIHQLIQPFEILIDIKNIQIKTHIDDHIIYYLDEKWTLEALSNIIKNCIEHVQEEGIIDITCHQNPLYDEIIIQDNGTGIDPDDLPHIFERFYKGKNATQQSVGIGLALSQMIIEKQNGTIDVENIYPGTKFTIHFYKEVV